MATTRVNGVEKGRAGLEKRKPAEEITEELEEEQRKRRKVIKINHVHHVREWIPETDAVSGEPNINIPVKLKAITRLETPEERDERKAAYAESKRIALAVKLKYWLETDHPWVEIRPHHASCGQSISYAASPNCLLGIVPYERIVKSPQVFVSCILATKKHAVNKKVYLVVGMLVDLFSNANNPVLLHSIIMHQEAPFR
jgi:hypothetical protein